MNLLKQLTVHGNLTTQQFYLGISPFDQTAKLANHLCALCNKGCESLVLICEISAGSGVTGSLGIAGCGTTDVVLQPGNTGSINSAASFQFCQFLRVVMGVLLLGSAVLNNGICFLFCSCLRFLCLGLSLF